MYLRPPHVTVATAIEPCDPNGPTPAHKNWRHANWLNWVSVVNKQDYARLQGFDFMVAALQVRWMLSGGPQIALNALLDGLQSVPHSPVLECTWRDMPYYQCTCDATCRRTARRWT